MRILADTPLFDGRRAPRRPEGDVVLWPTPAELRAYDLAFVAAPSDNVAGGDRTFSEEAAKGLWRFLGKGSG